MAAPRQKVVVITGASSGIGKTCALHLAKRGYRVFGAQRRTESGDGGAIEMETQRFGIKVVLIDAGAHRALGVERILEMPTPALRYSVGMLSQRIVVPLKRLLPQRLYEGLLIRVLGLRGP